MGVRVVFSESISALFGDLARLLTQAEHAPQAAERADAMKQLKAIHAELDAKLKEAEAGLHGGSRSKVEVAALRAAATTLASELWLIAAAEKMRTAKRKTPA